MLLLNIDTSYIFIIIGGTIMLSLLTVFTIAIFFLYQKRYYRHMHEKQQLQAQFQQTLLQSQLEIQEQTLQKISQEIHDNIGQVLSLAKLNLGTVDLSQVESTQTKLETTRNMVSKAIRDLRDLSRSMNSGYVTEMGLLRSIEYEVEMIRKTGIFETQLHVEGKPVKLDGQKELILFRIIQEIINNIIKHAEAKNVTIQVTYLPQLFSITIHDDGKGFDITLLDKGKNYTFGIGLRNMQNRAQLVGAELTLASIPGNGTTVTISLPCSF